MDRLKSKAKRGVYEINKLIIGGIKPGEVKRSEIKRNIYEHVRTTEMMVLDLVNAIEAAEKEGESADEVKELAEESLKLIQKMIVNQLQAEELVIDKTKRCD